MKYLFLLASTIAIVGCSNTTSTTTTSTTSYKPVGAPIVSKMDARAKLALDKLIKDKGITTDYKVIEYKKQIVAGVNHYFTLEIIGREYNFIVFETLDGIFIVR